MECGCFRNKRNINKAPHFYLRECSKRALMQRLENREWPLQPLPLESYRRSHEAQIQTETDASRQNSSTGLGFKALLLVPQPRYVAGASPALRAFRETSCMELVHPLVSVLLAFLVVHPVAYLAASVVAPSGFDLRLPARWRRQSSALPVHCL